MRCVAEIDPTPVKRSTLRTGTDAVMKRFKSPIWKSASRVSQLIILEKSILISHSGKISTTGEQEIDQFSNLKRFFFVECMKLLSRMNHA